MVEYLETVPESGDPKPMESNDQVVPMPPSSDSRKKHLSQDSAGQTRFDFNQLKC
jgi:hypothetical protein